MYSSTELGMRDGHIEGRKELRMGVGWGGHGRETKILGKQAERYATKYII